MLGSLGDGSRELQVELLSERDGLVVQMLVAFELRLLLHTRTHASTTTDNKRRTNTNTHRKKKQFCEGEKKISQFFVLSFVVCVGVRNKNTKTK